MRMPFERPIAWYLVFAMFIIGIAAPGVEASLSPSEAVSLPAYDRTHDLDTVRKALETKMVSQRLSEMGFTPEEINARVDKLSDSQLHDLAQKLDDLKVGGDGLGVVIAVLVIAILVVVLLHITGHRIRID